MVIQHNPGFEDGWILKVLMILKNKRDTISNIFFQCWRKRGQTGHMPRDLQIYFWDIFWIILRTFYAICESFAFFLFAYFLFFKVILPGASQDQSSIPVVINCSIISKKTFFKRVIFPGFSTLWKKIWYTLFIIITG